MSFPGIGGVLTFGNGSRIIAGHFQAEKDIDAYLGLEYDVIGIEEATTLTSRKHQDISTCCRTSKPNWRPFDKVFKAECNDPVFLNFQLYFYVEHSGTNLELACNVARRAQGLAPKDPYLADTVAWILVKCGDYRPALPLLECAEAGLRDQTVKFHLGMAHYYIDRGRSNLPAMDFAIALQLAQIQDRRHRYPQRRRSLLL